MQKIIEGSDHEDDMGGIDEDASEEEIEDRDHDSCSEQEGDEEDLLALEPEIEERASPNPTLISRNKKMLWYKEPIRSKFAKHDAKNIVKIFPRPHLNHEQVPDELSSFFQFITEEMIEKIVTYTNIFIRATQENYTRERDAKETTKEEILALLGMFYMAGLKKLSHTDFRELWATDGTGLMIFQACMGYKRFLFLLRCLRFDNVNDREQRKQSDKLAAIREILDQFVQKCKQNYCPGECLTIDEMLIPFRGRCSFIQYIPNKPAKYGIKVFALCDSKMFYVSNLEIYCGKQPQGQFESSNSPTDVVLRLIEPFKNKNRNLTTDNWYTSYPLAQKLFEKKLTLVGTLKKNKAEIPPELLPNKNRPINSSMFAFSKEATLVSFCPKKNKAVILLSTMHSNDSVDCETQKPEIILFYNSTKGGVDTVDQMCANYTVQKRTRRWPLVIFYQLMNIAGLNSNIIFNAIHPDGQNRRIYLKNLAMSLMKPHLIMRASVRNLSLPLKHFLSKYKPPEDPSEERPDKTRGRCVQCGRKKNRTTTIICQNCNQPACKEHVVTTHICLECNRSEGETSSS